MTNHHPTKAELRESFKNISNTPDRLQLEYDLAKEAKKLDIPVDEYRRYYDLRGEVSFIEELPPGWNLIGWVKYIWGLTGEQRVVLLLKTPKSVPIFAVLIAVAPIMMEVGKYILAKQQQTKQSHYQAWQIINSAKVSEGSSAGRIDALQDLVKDGVDLAKLDVTNAYLGGIKLPKAKLNNANFNNANLNKANLNNANLNNANLINVKLNNANLIYADLRGADLKGADFKNADIGAAKLYGVKNINPEQIKKANNWEDACYAPELRKQLKISSQNPECDKK
jgi:BTB/POZ domain-containing protein KCTD9